DEPTASLPATERRAMLALMRRLAAEGVAIVFVSHNLDEVLDVSDDISVFRNGRLVGTRAASEWSKLALVDAMLGPGGQALAGAFLHGAAEKAGARRVESISASGDEVLGVDDLRVPGVVHGVSLQVRAGEIVGI